MKRKRTRLGDLHSDLLRHIMIFVAKSSDGAVSFARLISVCKMFEGLSIDKDILKLVEFNGVMLFGTYGSLYQNNGLLFRCACAGNIEARQILIEYVEDLLISVKANMVCWRFAQLEFLAKLRVVYRQAFTRGMRRRMESILEGMKILIDASDKDVKKAEELLDAMQNSRYS